MPFKILRNDITTMKVDAIVTSTNSKPIIDGGVDQKIHEVAGTELLIQRQLFGILKTSQAIITQGYNLSAKHVIHVVGPVYQEGHHNERQVLHDTYSNALNLALEHNVKSIAFPLISTGRFRFPRGEALQIALHAIKTFLDTQEMMIYLVVYDESSYQISLKHFVSVKSYIDDYSNEEYTNQRIFYSKVEANQFQPIVDKASKHRSLDDVIDQVDETFAKALFRLIDEKKLDDIAVYKKANIDRKLFSKIKSNFNYQPSKVTTLAFALALELNLDETKDLLAKAGYALSSSSKFDLIIQYFIENENFDLYEINQVLFAFDQKTIGGIV